MSNTWNMAQLARYVVSDNGSISLSPDISGTQTYATIAELPLTDNTTGAQAFVSENNRLYIWSGTGWYNIALVNTSPTAITGASGSYGFATDGTPIEITLVSSDPEGIPITWSYAVTSGSLTNNGGTTATVSQAANVFTITPSTNEDYVGSFSLTFTASDGVNLATATSSFTLEFKILNSRYTTLMLKAEAAGSNTTFVDSSTNNFTITRNGDVTQGTFGPYSKPEGAWSNYFDGSGDYLSTPANNVFTFGTGDFTIECWVNKSDHGHRGIWQISSTAGGLESTNYSQTLAFGYQVGKWQLYATGGAVDGPSFSLSTNTWYHAAVVRNNGTTKLYINGIENISTADTYNYSGSYMAIGGYFNATYLHYGYISNLRVVKGTALYTSNFTPPTEPLTAIAGTSLLTCQSNRFKDNSTNNFAITKNGDVKVTAFSPYDQMAYDPAVNSGSVYFDGSGSTQLSIGSLQNSWNQTGDWTMEFWIYPKSLANGWIFRQASTGGTIQIWTYASNNIRLSIYGAGNVDSTALKLDNWYHVAVVNNGTTDVITLYVNGVSQGSTSSGSMGNYTTHYLGGTQDGVNSPIGYISDFRIVNSQIYTANFTPPTAPLTAVADTSLLLKCTNGNIVDYSGNSNLSVIGNTAVNTTTTKYAAGSVYFDGSGDSLNLIGNLAFTMPGDFTAEAWVFMTAYTGSDYSAIFGFSKDDENTGWNILVTPNGTPHINVQMTYTNCTGTIPLNQWTHVALVRSGSGSGNVKLYINGVASSTTLTTTATATSPSIVMLGNYPGISARAFKGYIEDARVTKGLARYTANFTPPTSELRG